MSLWNRFWNEREFRLRSKSINFGICEELKGHLRESPLEFKRTLLESKRIWREIWRTSLFHLESKGKSKGSEGNRIWNLTEIEGKAKGIPFWNLREIEGESKGYPVGIFKKLKGTPFGIWQKLRRNLLFLAISFVIPRNPSYIDNISPICFCIKIMFDKKKT